MSDDSEQPTVNSMAAQILEVALKLKEADRTKDMIADLEKQAIYYCDGAMRFIAAAIREARGVRFESEEADGASDGRGVGDDSEGVHREG